MLGSSR